MNIEHAIVLPSPHKPLNITWQGEPVGPEKCTPIVIDAGEAFIPGYISGNSTVAFGLFPRRDPEDAKALALQALAENCC